MSRDSLDTPIYVSIPIGDSIVVDLIYRSCLVTIGVYKTRVDLLFFNMVDVDVILGMYWLYLYHAILDCHVKIVTLAMLGLPRLEGRGSLGHVPSRVVSFLKTQPMIKKGCLAYLAFVRHVSDDIPMVDSVSVVREFPDVFPADLPDMPSDRDMDFGIELVSSTHPISIPPYRMALA
ncbi:uncharacterized protein [Nicotiana tomentosiformis]|uniref:uncharacterized protein n=1 Tax=Nicotiana tomentosiformis TaxID=4098 RepID=UPI00388C97B5